MIPKSMTLATRFETTSTWSWAGEVIQKRGDDRREPTEIRDDHTVQEVDPLDHAHGNKPGDGGEERREQDGQEDVRRVGRPHLGAVDHDADGDQRQPGRVEHQEHDLGVGRGVLLGVELLKLLHGLEAEGRGGVVQTEHVGREVHDHGSVDRVVTGDLGEEAMEEGPYDLGQRRHHAALLSHAHESKPEGEHAREAQRDLEAQRRHLEGAVHHRREDLGILEHHELHRGHHEGDEKEPDPDDVEGHGVLRRRRGRAQPPLRVSCDQVHEDGNVFTYGSVVVDERKLVGDNRDVLLGAPGSEGAWGGIAHVRDQGHARPLGEPPAQRGIVGVIDTGQRRMQRHHRLRL
jgi:hypothetical protein